MDDVRAEDMMPCQIGVFCDHCDMVIEHDYWVRESDDKATRFGYARKYLATLGWSYRDGVDLCDHCTTARFLAEELG